MANFGQHSLELQQQEKYDSNGELIIYEGNCWCEGIKSHVQNYYCVLALSGFGLPLPVTIPLGIFCAKTGCEKWRLYLTNKSVCFDPVSNFPQCSFGTGRATIRIAITDIEAIQTQSNIVSAGCCSYGRNIASPKTIQIEVKLGTQYSGKCCGLVEIPTVYEVYFCSNAEEFVEAVKKQMNTMVRD